MNKFCSLIQKINNFLHFKKEFGVIKNTRKNKQFLSILYNEGFLEFFVTEQQILLFKFKFNSGEPVIKKIFLVRKKGQLKKFKFFGLWGLSNADFCQSIFSSNSGLVTSQLLKSMKKGGFFFCIILI